MNIIQFIRVIRKNIALLIIIPIITGVLVYFFTRNQGSTYYSETKIYSGIATSFNVETGMQNRVDYYTNGIAFDNMVNIINSRSTLEEVSMRLLATNLMLQIPDPNYISEDSYENLHKILPPAIKERVVDINSLEKTYENIKAYKDRNERNFFYKLINGDHIHYSIQALSKLQVNRVDNSDMLKISYECNDPGICYQTLNILNEVFIKNYSGIHQNQTGEIVSYFEEQLKVAEQRLRDAEDRLQRFNMENKIINYYEQSKHIAAEKKDLELAYQQEKMAFIAANSAVKKLDEQMARKRIFKIKGNEILSLRAKLAEITQKIVFLEIDQNTNEGKPESRQIRALRKEAESIKDELKKKVNSLYELGSTREGVSDDLLKQNWINSVIAYEEQNARVQQLGKHIEKFNQEYETFAPLGATMKKIEREISVAEREYLSLLHSLAMAKLKQQNLEVSSNTRVMDSPFFPTEPKNPGKWKILTLMGIAAGFIITLSILLLLEYFDTTLRSPERAKKQIGLELAGALPLIQSYQDHLSPSWAEHRAIELLANHLKLKIRSSKNMTRPFTVLFFSTQKADGKSWVSERLGNYLVNFGSSIIYLDCKKDKVNVDIKRPQTPAKDLNRFGIISNSSTTKEAEEEEQTYDFVFIEIPTENIHPYIYDLATDIDLGYLICRANRSWNNSDRFIYRELVKIVESKAPPELILNGVDIDNIESILGEIPKKRSYARRRLKDIVTFNFFRKKTII